MHPTQKSRTTNWSLRNNVNCNEKCSSPCPHNLDHSFHTLNLIRQKDQYYTIKLTTITKTVKKTRQAEQRASSGASPCKFV